MRLLKRTRETRHSKSNKRLLTFCEVPITSVPMSRGVAIWNSRNGTGLGREGLVSDFASLQLQASELENIKKGSSKFSMIQPIKGTTQTSLTFALGVWLPQMPSDNHFFEISSSRPRYCLFFCRTYIYQKFYFYFRVLGVNWDSHRPHPSGHCHRRLQRGDEITFRQLCCPAPPENILSFNS